MSGLIQRGQVLMADLDPVKGHEQGRIRPVLVISDDLFSQGPSGLVIILPITGMDRGIPAHVKLAPPEGGLSKPSVILCDQIRTISRQRLIRAMGHVASPTLGRVEEVLRFLLRL